MSVFKFIAKLRRNYIKLLHIPSPSHAQPSHYQYPPSEWYQWTHIIVTQNSKFTSEFTLGGVHSMGFDQCLMTCIHHYSIRVVSLLYIVLSSAYSSVPPPTLGIQWFFYCLHSLSFPKCHIVRIIQYIAF